MKSLNQAVRVARNLMAQGLTGSDLADGLRPSASVLSSDDKKILASAISREYFILGQAAHDPNLYKTCQAAKVAKQKSTKPEFKILTYKTPMCASCGLNRSGHCGLMGGRLIAGPDDIPERAVHQTADLISSEESLDQDEVKKISMSRSSSTNRLASLHQERIQASSYVDKDSDLKAESHSRVAASILDSAEPENITGRRLRGSSRRLNAEVLGVGSVDESQDSQVIRKAYRIDQMIDHDMIVDIPGDTPVRRSAGVELDSYTEMDIPERVQPLEAVENDPEIQASLFKLSHHASKLLSQGQMHLRSASKIYHRMQDLVDLGAVHTQKTSAISRQLNALGGGLEV